MTHNQHIIELLQDFLEGDLPSAKRQEVENHLAICSACSEELGRYQKIIHKAASIRKNAEPERDLWPAIESRITKQSKISALFEMKHKNNRKSAFVDERSTSPLQARTYSFRWIAGIAAVFTIAAVGIWAIWSPTRQPGPSWQVLRIEGNPSIGTKRFNTNAALHVGEWLETDETSRAQISVGSIGEVAVEPNTRIRLLNASNQDHRLSLDRGGIHATVSAPPRLFIVETSSALAVDLGCEYSLHVDSAGSGILVVAMGWVSLESYGRRSLVPGGAECITRPGFGPGIPFSSVASASFRSALGQFDFTGESDRTLKAILAEAKDTDCFSLWHLLFRVQKEERARVYDRMVTLVRPPKGVTRAGVLQGDEKMLEAWESLLDLDFTWRFSS